MNWIQKIIVLFITFILISCSSKKEPVYDTTCDLAYLEDISKRKEALTDDDIYRFLYSFESGICKNEPKYLDYRRDVFWMILNDYPEVFVRQLDRLSDIARQNIIDALSNEKERVDPSLLIDKLESIQILSVTRDEIIRQLESWPVVLRKQYAGNYAMCVDMEEGMLTRRNHCPEIVFNADGTGMCYAYDDMGFKWEVKDSVMSFNFRNKNDQKQFVAKDSVFKIHFYKEKNVEYLKLIRDSINWYLLGRDITE